MDDAACTCNRGKCRREVQTGQTLQNTCIIPDWLHARFEGLENDRDAHRLMAVSVAVEQVLELAAEGIENFHFFTLNKSALATTVCRSLGLSPNLEAKSAA